MPKLTAAVLAFWRGRGRAHARAGRAREAGSGVDDDGASGNKNLQAHMGHENDIIPANPDGICGAPDDDIVFD